MRHRAEHPEWLAAVALGKAAFEAGKPCVPALDAAFVTSLTGNTLGALPLLKAWHRGWAVANVEAT